MSCDVGEVTERLENELCYDYNYELCSFSNLSVTSPTSQLILQPFRRFTYVKAHSPTLPQLYLRHSSFSNPSSASPTSQVFHLFHLANRPWRMVYFASFHSVMKYGIIFSGISLHSEKSFHLRKRGITIIIKKYKRETCKLMFKIWKYLLLLGVVYEGRRKVIGVRMSCDVGEAMEGLENEL